MSPIDTAENHTIENLGSHVNINLFATIATTALFLHKAKETNIPVVIANVTSGAANRSTYGWSAYGSTKAGLNRYTETVALEQEELGTNNKVILFNPGIMDTEMQGEIRSSNKEAFKDVDTFKEYKQDNRLRDTDVVAGTLVDVLINRKDIRNGKNHNVNDLL